jgi:hypothetical protein
MQLQLFRKYHEFGTNGELYIDGGPEKIADTIELPWKKNQRRVSCIPERIYKLRKRYTTKFGWHCVVEHVPGRDGILIHAFNDAIKESKGCIAPVTKIEGPGKGSESRSALKNLMMTLDNAFQRREPVYLIIKNLNNEQLNSKSKKANTKVL